MESIARNQATVAKIQQLEDAATNPLTGEAWPNGHAALLNTRRALPVYKRLDEILDTYHQDQVFIITSGTGLGKSAQIPQALAYDEYASGLRIACTQPRRLAATELARRVAHEMGVKLGEEVGFQIGGKKRVNKNEKKTRLVYMTEGVLLGLQHNDKNLSEYSCIIIDEAHERTMETDLLMMTLKQILRRRKDLKLIIMSTTMHGTQFRDYFDNCEIVHIEGQNSKVDILYSTPTGTLSDFSFLAARIALWIHKNRVQAIFLYSCPARVRSTQFATSFANVPRISTYYRSNDFNKVFSHKLYRSLNGEWLDTSRASVQTSSVSRRDGFRLQVQLINEEGAPIDCVYQHERRGFERVGPLRAY